MGDKEDGHGFEGSLDKDMLVTDPDGPNCQKD